MNCPVRENNAEIFLDYCMRKLDWDQAEILERHMRDCGECRKMSDSQKRVWAALDSWEAEPVSSDFDARLHSRIARERNTLWARVKDFVSFRPAWSVTAGLCATVLCVVLVRQPPVGDPGYGETIEVAEVEQAETLAADIDMLKELGVIAQAEKPGETEEGARTL